MLKVATRWVLGISLVGGIASQVHGQGFNYSFELSTGPLHGRNGWDSMNMFIRNGVGVNPSRVASGALRVDDPVPDSRAFRRFDAPGSTTLGLEGYDRVTFTMDAFARGGCWVGFGPARIIDGQ
jgi:hypothetical protein